jgi:maltose O-acetyltransferase
LRLDKWEAAEPIVIMDNVWLGGGVVVGPESREHRRRRGAVVVRDLPANVVAVGNPARVIRTFDG